MNKKHLALLVVGLLIAGCIQGTLWMNKRLDAMTQEETKAASAAQQALNLLNQERTALRTLEEGSKPLIDFLNAWEPHFQSLNTPQSAELGISMRIKEAGLVTLAQRYEGVSTRGDTTIPRVMRVTLTIEDNYAKTINWLGQLESEIPTMRIANLRLSKGQIANDIRMDVVLEIPLAVGVAVR